MADQRDKGDENPELKVGRIKRLTDRKVPRRVADAHDGEPDATRHMTMFPTANHEKRGGPFEDGEELRNPTNVPIPKLPKDIFDNLEREEGLGEGADGGGKRYNAGKLRMDLTPPEWEWALADVTTQGSKKYDERNWELGMKWSTMVGCMKRHINKFLAGERYDGKEFDKEKGTTGCHHLAMVAWNALALMVYDLREIGENDLPDDATLLTLLRVNAADSDLGNNIHTSEEPEDDTES